MIVFLTVSHHGYTVFSLADGTFGPALPKIMSLPYESMLTAESAPAATYVFTDFDRLSAWERLLAADLFRALQAAGCRCLNDPAVVLTRLPLLRALHRAGLNPFRAWRVEDLAESAPAPWWRRGGGPRFPVFIRNEADHGRPLTGLLPDPAALRDALAGLLAAGLPPSGLLCIEFCAEPRWPDVWAKFGTFRIGEAISTDHAVIEDNWCVKHGTEGLATPEMLRWERDQVAANAYAAALRPAFALAGIEYGRADHATVRGQEVVFEINTNPYLAPLSKQVSTVRDEGVAIARARMAEALWALDGGDGTPLSLPAGERVLEHRSRSAALGLPYRP